MKQIIVSTSLILVIVVSLIPLARCKTVDSICSGYNCGNIKNLSYPFWGGEIPQNCGHPSFKLTCVNDTHSVIDIDELEFVVLQVNQSSDVMTNGTMRIARWDLRDGPCSSMVRFVNTTLNSDLFDFATLSLLQTMNLYYGCREPPFQPGPVIIWGNLYSCGNGDIIYNSIGDLATNLNLTTCKHFIQVPVLTRTYSEREGNRAMTALGFEQLLNQGFDVRYEVNDTILCRQCSESGGVASNDVTKKRGLTFKVILGIGFGTGAVAIALICITICYFRRALIAIRSMMTKNHDLETTIKGYEHQALKRYRFSEIKKMTNSFRHKLGQGGYGEVYSGKLADGRLVAVKVLCASKGKNAEEFINEVTSISMTSHVNVVTLFGFCLEGAERVLVYEFMPNGSLEKFIYKDDSTQITPKLKWEKLLEISKGIARGLEYLHRGCKTRIVHFDIKPHNILLDEDFCPKISDFGLAKLSPRKESTTSMSLLDARGTFGYKAPEIIDRNVGGVSSKSDVYSYGMMILEMVGGRKNVKVEVSRASEIYFPDWIHKHVELGCDINLWGEITTEENEIAKKMILVGLWCIQAKPLDRPSMSKVIEMLEGKLEALQIPPKPQLERFRAEIEGVSSTSRSPI